MACGAGTALAQPEPSETSRIELRRGDRSDELWAGPLTQAESSELSEIKQADDFAARARSLLSVSVGADRKGDQPALLGRYRLEDEFLVFLPRFPLLPGETYLAELRLAGAEPRRQVFSMPASDAPVAKVAAVYPSAAVLPENQLKFYLHFSAPMRQGVAFEHLRLLDARGKPDELPFVNVGRELWDRSGTRLTLLLDPGRIKHGLKPREEQGPILHEGDEHTLVIDAAWPDALGRPLGKAHEKRFRVAAPDAEMPAVKRWRIRPPQAGSREPLLIDFDEPLDHALLLDALAVRGPTAELMDGTPNTAREERQWAFAPTTAWPAGDYRLEATATLEDLAGNSLAKPFEVDIFDKVDAPDERPAVVEIPFRVQ
jgi:hypothetical protein